MKFAFYIFSFLFVYEIACVFHQGWMVEVWGWNKCMSGVYKSFQREYSSRFSLRLLDEFRDLVTFSIARKRVGSGCHDEEVAMVKTTIKATEEGIKLVSPKSYPFDCFYDTVNSKRCGRPDVLYRLQSHGGSCAYAVFPCSVRQGQSVELVNDGRVLSSDPQSSLGPRSDPTAWTQG